MIGYAEIPRLAFTNGSFQSNLIDVTQFGFIDAGGSITLQGGSSDEIDHTVFTTSRAAIHCEGAGILGVPPAGSGLTITAVGNITLNSGTGTYARAKIGGTFDLIKGPSFFTIITQSDFITNGGAQLGGDATVDSGQDLHIEARGNIILNSFATISGGNRATGTVTLIADHDVRMFGSTTIGNFFAGDQVSIVCDNLFPTPPLFGPGLFFMASGATVTTVANGPIRVFTSQQHLNTISGTFNGFGFTPGTTYVDTLQEMWETYFFNSFNGVPFTIFYKDSLERIKIEVELYGADPFLALAELYRILHPYDEYIRLAMEYAITYNRDAFHAKIKPRHTYASYSVIPNDYLFLRLRNHNYEVFKVQRDINTL